MPYLIYYAGEVWGMGTRKTSVEIDEDLLEAAKRILETTTVKDTVEEAFREVTRVEARRREVEALTRMKDLDLADPDVMAAAWRS
jgi:Arc/MetJ family transcription regulator